MATRAEQYRAAEEQARQKERPRKTPKSFPGVVRTPTGPVKKRGLGHSATRNVSQHAAKKATFALDDSTDRPSRKSTRKSANRSKFESALRRRSIAEARSPETRAAKATVPKRARHKIG